MRIYTSYHSNSRKLGIHKIQPINISIHPPRWANYPSIFELAPSADMLHLNKASYIPKFEAILNRSNPQEILDRITKISDENGGKDVALLCYESLKKPGEWCHREIVAEWLNYHFPELDVKEWVSPSEQAKKSQIMMF